MVVINGSGGCGKDTFVNFCRENKEYAILNRSTVDPIKEAATILGWNGDKTDESRKFLSDLKDLATKYSDCSFSYIAEEFNTYKYVSKAIMFVHCREPEEIQRFVEVFGAKTVLIDSSARKPIILTNHADAKVYDYHYDYVVYNNSNLEALKEKALYTLEKLANNEKPVCSILV
jgi:dephospho-CoA kinase